MKFLLTIFILSLVASSLADEEGTDNNDDSRSMDFQRLLKSDASVEDIVDKLKDAIKDIIDKKPWNSQLTEMFENVDPKIGDAFMKKLAKLKDLVNKVDFNAGFPALQENFRIMGIPFYKYWALWIVLDPFEI